jgi:hypothetical protein
VSGPFIPVIDGRSEALAPAGRRREQALAVLAACLGWLPLGGLLARLADPLVRRWMRRSGSPYVDEIDATAQALGRPGIWLLHGAYLFGCTALADDTPRGPRLRRTLDWPFPGLGRLVEIMRQRGPAGAFLNVTWPGFVGVLTAVAPERFAAAINQAPMRCRTRGWALLWLDYIFNAVSALLRSGRLPPEHLLRQVFETCETFDEARHRLENTPVARPVIFTLVGVEQGQCLVIERECLTARSHTDATVAANAWQDMTAGWRPRACGEGSPIENNRRRSAALVAWSGRDADDFGWAMPPVINACTRLTVEMCPRDGTVAVAGWEADGHGGAMPVTAVTRLHRDVRLAMDGSVRQSRT